MFSLLYSAEYLLDTCYYTHIQKYAAQSFKGACGQRDILTAQTQVGAVKVELYCLILVVETMRIKPQTPTMGDHGMRAQGEQR